MALSPEDVVNKRFTSTKFREGYDQDEVDDFLDEVVVELRRLVQENEELRAAVAKAAAAPPVVKEVVVAAPIANVPAPTPAPAIDPMLAAAGGVPDENGSTSLLVLARRLHEEHVREGLEKRDELIAEGQSTAARLVRDAEIEMRDKISSLEKQRAVLQQRVDELRAFESEYRRKIKMHLEDLIKDLDTTGTGA